MSDNESIAMFRDSAKDFLSAADQRQRTRTLESSGGGFDRSTWTQIAELGWLSILVPEDQGGLGLTIAEVSAIATEAGRELLPEPFVDAGVHPVSLLVALPDGALRNKMLVDIQIGSMVAGVAWQERAGEIDPGHPATLGHLEGTDVHVSGRKRFVRPGIGADGWIVFIQLDDEPALVWIDSTAHGVQSIDDYGVDGMATSTLEFDRAIANPIAQGEVALSALKAANETARIAQGAELCGIGRRALELTREYLTTRVQFGKPIGSFQALQHRLVDGLIQVELAEASLRDGLASLSDSNRASIASRIKARCAYAATEMTRMAIQLHGAIGTTNEYDIGLYFKRAMALASWWGNPLRIAGGMYTSPSTPNITRRMPRSENTPTSRLIATGTRCPKPNSGRWFGPSSPSTIPRIDAICRTGRPGPNRRTGT